MFKYSTKIQIAGLFFVAFFSLSLIKRVGNSFIKDRYSWGVKYNNNLLFNSTNDTGVKWVYSIHRDSINNKDSIELFFHSDYSRDFNPMIIIKDSSLRKMIRRFPGTDKIAVKDVLRYASEGNNKFWLLYTEQDREKDGTILWDIEKTYPKKHGYPRLNLTIIE